jgi:hypothetical protein
VKSKVNPGNVYGRLTVQNNFEYVSYGKTQPDGSRRKKKRWYCQCNCGKIKLVDAGNLINGSVQSCGCLKAELSKERGMARRGIKTKPPGASNRTTLVYNYKANAKNRGYSMNLSDEQIINLASENCHYCNRPINHIYRDNVLWDITYNGIDRMDNNIGYEIENCVACCSMCNRMKLNYSYEDFLKFIEAIYDHLGLSQI